MIRRIVAVSALGAVGLLGLTAVPASAGIVGPNVNLKESASGVVKFKPMTLTGIHLVQKPQRCKPTNYTLSITNKTASTQSLDENGTLSTDLLPGEEIFYCLLTYEPTATFTVPGTGATLTVTSSS